MTQSAKKGEVLTCVLASLRNEAGMKQAELAKALGKPQSFVSKYESGERRLDLVELQEICVALGTSLAELVARFEKSSE